jgi:hypothetical protein
LLYAAGSIEGTLEEPLSGEGLHQLEVAGHIAGDEVFVDYPLSGGVTHVGCGHGILQSCSDGLAKCG